VILRKPKKRKSRKYSFDQISKQDPISTMSEGDQKLVARLIGKYGRETVFAAVEVSPGPQPRGRPSRGKLPLFEDIALAQWFEGEVEEFRDQGSTHPIRDAEILTFQMQFGRAPDPASREFKAWRLNFKKKRLRGSRELKEVKRRLVP
jgi:hypothetical protein